MPIDATAAQQAEMRQAYGFDEPLPIQYGIWLWQRVPRRSRQLDRQRPAGAERGQPGGWQFADPRFGRNPDRLHVRHLLRVRRRIFSQTAPLDKAASALSVFGVSVPHYWLGIVLVIIFSAQLGWLPPTGAGPDGSGNWRPDTEHLRYIILPAITMSVIPMGIIARTVRALVADILLAGIRAGAARQGPRRMRRVQACGEQRRARRHSPSWACNSATCSAARS